MAVKKSTKSKSAKFNSKNSWLKRHWIALAVIVAFAGIGTYIIGVSSAATKYYVSSLGYSCPTLPTLKNGSTGDCVKAVQKGLNNRNGNLKLMNGTAWTPLVIDGKYGTNTYNAVKRFQTEWSSVGKKLAVDGIVGPATWDRFLNDCMVFSDPALVGWHYDSKNGTSYYTKPGYLCGT